MSKNYIIASKSNLKSKLIKLNRQISLQLSLNVAKSESSYMYTVQKNLRDSGEKSQKIYSFLYQPDNLSKGIKGIRLLLNYSISP